MGKFASRLETLLPVLESLGGAPDSLLTSVTGDLQHVSVGLVKLQELVAETIDVDPLVSRAGEWLAVASFAR